MITEEQVNENMKSLLLQHIELMKEQGLTPAAIEKRVFTPGFESFIMNQAAFEVVS